MKICPECAFANDERFPTCVWCNTVLVNVKSTPSADPSHPEHADAWRLRRRRARQVAQLRFAVLCYSVLLTSLAIYPGLISDRLVLGEIFLASALVGFAVVRGYLGQFTAMVVQAAASTTLIVASGLVNPFTSFALVAHVVLPAFFQQWVDLIEDGHS